MPALFRPHPEGYLATFVGPLRLDDVDEVREAAEHRFGDGSLRWVVLDMGAAWIDPPTDDEAQIRQLALVFQMAGYVSEANTPELRVAVVTHDQLTTALTRLTATAVELDPKLTADTNIEVARFDDVREATIWARAS